MLLQLASDGLGHCTLWMVNLAVYNITTGWLQLGFHFQFTHFGMSCTYLLVCLELCQVLP